MRWLITGASGFVGRRLTTALVKQGALVRTAVRSMDAAVRLPSGSEPVEIGNVDGATDWSTALHDVSTVVHLAARAHVLNERAEDPAAEFNRVNVDGTLALFESAKRAGVRRFVYISSVGVLGDRSGNEPLNDNSEPAPVTPYARSKLEAETRLLESSGETELVILRPPLVYGPENPGNFLRLLDLVASGLPLPLASVNSRRSFVYIDNLTSAIIAAARVARLDRQRFLVTDRDTANLPSLISMMGQFMGRPARLIPFPPSLLAMGLRLLGKSTLVSALLGSLVVDGSRFAGTTGWTPDVSLQEGISRTVAWYLTQRSSSHA